MWPSSGVLSHRWAARNGLSLTSFISYHLATISVARLYVLAVADNTTLSMQAGRPIGMVLYCIVLCCIVLHCIVQLVPARSSHNNQSAWQLGPRIFACNALQRNDVASRKDIHDTAVRAVISTLSFSPFFPTPMPVPLHRGGDELLTLFRHDEYVHSSFMSFACSLLTHSRDAYVSRVCNQILCMNLSV